LKENHQEVAPKKHHHLRVKLIIGLIILGLAFIGLTLSHIRPNYGWIYWNLTIPIFALLCLFLSWYLRHKSCILPHKTIWHEIVQWVGLSLAVGLIFTFVHLDWMKRFEAGWIILTLLSLNIFITGIYVELTFLIIGIVLGLFTLGAALLIQHLYTIMLPITIVMVILLVWVAKKRG